MIKFKLYLDKDAETNWLNEMSEKGWALKSFFAGFYTFEECEAGKYTYQIDFGEKFFKVRDEYREFMKEAGIEIVQTWGWWVILRKPASEGEFELYTDVESSIEHYSKIRRMFKIATVIEIICLWMEIMAATIGKVPYAVPAAFFIGAIMIGFIRIIIHTTNIINNLKERQTGIPVEKRRNVSPILAVGMLLNGLAIAIQESVSGNVKIAVQILAIIFMLMGLWDIFRKNH